ncbi:MAG: hypothetical protein SPF04_05215 [Bacilli bacterium]|nr:hypothetical protein [Bacilli bacterium]
MNYNPEIIVLDIIITAVAYLFLPFILFHIRKKEYTEKRKKKLILFNSIIIALVFIIIRIIFDFENPVISFAPALLFYYINKAIWIKKKEKIEKEEKNTLHSKVIKKKKKRSLEKNKILLIIVIVFFIVVIFILTFSLIKQNSTIKEQENRIEELASGNSSCQLTKNELLDKIAFFDEHIVFEIEEFKGKYLSYNCMNYISKDKEISFLAYNIEQAKAKGLEEYKCTIRVELGLENYNYK